MVIFQGFKGDVWSGVFRWYDSNMSRSVLGSFMVGSVFEEGEEGGEGGYDQGVRMWVLSGGGGLVVGNLLGLVEEDDEDRVDVRNVVSWLVISIF